MKIDLPSIAEQQKVVFELSTREAINQLNKNLSAPELPGQTEINEAKYSNAHLLVKDKGFEAPHCDVVGAYFRNFQSHFEQYNTDKTLAVFLGLSSDRRIRDFKQGVRKVPYDVWRKFLVITGRAPQEILPVMAFIKG
jgi:hypothetical protein